MTTVDKKSERWNLVSEYCDSSTIHGVRYLGEFYRPILERIFWVIIFSVSLFMCAKLTWQVLDKWENHPVIVSFDDKSTAVGAIPFPAVTLCPGNQIDSNIFQFSPKVDDIFGATLSGENITHFTPDEWELTETFFDICTKMIFKDLLFPEITMRNTIVENLLRVHPSFEKAFDGCSWKGRPENCTELWTKSLTGDGICYTFNMLGFENILRDEALHSDYFLQKSIVRNISWEPDSGYHGYGKGDTPYPRRVLSAGFELGLSLELTGDTKDLEIYCGGIVPGFKMILHEPHEIPQSLRNFVRIPFGQETLLAIKPTMRSTSSKLKSYSPKKRQCYFTSERYLRFFKIYTQSSCEFECLGNYSLALCNCVDFHLPRTSDTPVCRPKDITCLEDAFKEMVLNEMDEGQCNCLPSCNSINYGMEVSQSEIISNNNTITQKATINVFYKEDQFWSSVRSELYGITEVIASIGGILGLFMGVSVLSVIEISYFLTFRFIRSFKSKEE